MFVGCQCRTTQCRNNQCLCLKAGIPCNEKCRSGSCRHEGGGCRNHHKYMHSDELLQYVALGHYDTTHRAASPSLGGGGGIVFVDEAED